jgi:hypothetical protein
MHPLRTSNLINQVSCGWLCYDVKGTVNDVKGTVVVGKFRISWYVTHDFGFTVTASCAPHDHLPLFAAVALVLAMKIGVVVENVVGSMFADRLIAKGVMLEVFTILCQVCRCECQ